MTYARKSEKKRKRNTIPHNKRRKPAFNAGLIDKGRRLIIGKIDKAPP